jgi:hypothetical protein
MPANHSTYWTLSAMSQSDFLWFALTNYFGYNKNVFHNYRNQVLLYQPKVTFKEGIFMAITLTEEKSFAILLSITDLDGCATKKEVLNNIHNRKYVSFSKEDLEMKTNRKELYWRNNFAFVRKTLADNGYIDDSSYNQWKISSAGTQYLHSLSKKVLSSQNSGFRKLTSYAVQKAEETLNKINIDFEKYKNDFAEDQMTIQNEIQESLNQRIKRYKIIVDELKQKYDGCCQIENCGFTFIKTNGEYYAEGHHILPLVKGGKQNKENVVILCANHHRMFHYAKVQIGQVQKGRRPIKINGETVYILYID